MKLRDSLAPTLARAKPHFLERHSVRFGIFRTLAEGAQPATGHANVGGVDMAVDVEIGRIAVHPFANQVGQIAHRQDIVRAVQRYPIVEAKPLAGFHLLTDDSYR